MKQEKKTIFDQMLSHIGDQSKNLPSIELTGFVGMHGQRANGELMVIGRSANEWIGNLSPAAFLNKEERQQFIDQIFSRSDNETNCPLQWVSDCWGAIPMHRPRELPDQCSGSSMATGEDCLLWQAWQSNLETCTCKTRPVFNVQCTKCVYNKNRYNTKKSAFWRTIQRVILNLQIATDSATDWPSRITWTNLYKVSPAKGGNPYSTLMELQRPFCGKLLRQEIIESAPKRLLFLTGINWFEPFIPLIGEFIDVVRSTGLVQLRGYLHIPEADYKSSIVVAQHPQGKPGDRFVLEVTNAFRDIPVT
ncbi:MAG: hypothetical protein AB1611_16375 [bacterium]